MRTEVPTKILMLAATAAGITVNDLIQSCKRRDLVDKRRIVCKLLRDSGFSTTAIGRAIFRDHASVVYLTKSCLEIMAFDNDYRSLYHEAKGKFESMIMAAEEDREIIIRYISLVITNEIDNLIANPRNVKRVVNKISDIVADYKADEYNF